MYEDAVDGGRAGSEAGGWACEAAWGGGGRWRPGGGGRDMMNGCSTDTDTEMDGRVQRCR